MPLKYVPVADLQSGSKVDAVYLLAGCQTRPKKDGGTFLTLVLRDATGKIAGVMWDNFDAVTNGRIAENDFVEVGGEVLTYNNQLQFRVARIAKVDEAAVDSRFFLPTCPIPVEQLEREFWQIVDQVKDSDYLRLLRAVFGNPEFWEKFRRAPSAVSMHQAYLGGLLEHTLCVVRNALKLADNYPAVDRSLLITGGLVHDMGKTMEYSYEKKISYTDCGRLVGHISMGCAMVEMHCAALSGFPPEKKVLVQHMILSHHGYYEFGSPKRPKNLEALILHHADITDAQVSNYMEYLETARRSGVRWEYSTMFERYMFADSPNVQGAGMMREFGYPVPEGGSARRDNDSVADDTAADLLAAAGENDFVP